MSRQPPPPPQNGANSRNEYIPQYISAKPFYAEDLLKDTEYLSHQRSKAEQKDTLDKAKWYSRGNRAGPAATKYRKGACENCGAMTHKTKECLSRPRKQGAKYTGRDIQADEVVQEISLGWDAKRDRWNGYDARDYDAVVKDYQDMEALRKAAAASSTPANDNDNDDTTAPTDPQDAPADGDHYAEETDMGRNQPTSTRQLRLREDTAKYLLDLNLDSAKYDPKTRSMDTTAQTLNTTNNTTDLASEGFARPTTTTDPTSDASAFETAQRFAWDLTNKPATASAPVPAAEITSAKVHLEANPTASALAHKKALEENDAARAKKAAYLAEKYGAPPNSSSAAITSQRAKKALVTSTSAYATYDPETGREIDATTGKVKEREVVRSKYAEDVWPGNHTSVFGSWWRDGKWGYRCCHSFVRNSYCTGEDGRRGFEEEEARRLGRDLIEDGTVDGGENEEAEGEVTRKRKVEEDGDGDRGKRSRTENAS